MKISRLSFRHFATATLIATLFFLQPDAVSAQAGRALLVEGKTLLHQRVLTRPNAVLLDAPAGTASNDALVPFTPYYVFERSEANGEEWLRLGTAVEGATDGWLPATATIEWNHTISVAFTPAANRSRLPFYRERAELENLVIDEKVVPKVQQTVADLEAGLVGEDYPAVALEPATFVDIEKDFYLLPVLNFADTYTYEGFELRLLEVASVSAEEEAQAGQQAATGAQPAAQQATQTATPLQTQPTVQQPVGPPPVGIAFVIDTTSSMGPYIERTREVVGTVSSRLEAAALAQSTRLALIGFRDNNQVAPSLGYVTQTFVDFSANVMPADFQRATSAISPATTSSQDFEEDVYSGVRNAIMDLSWGPDDIRYVVVIGDAGPRTANDQLSSTRLSSADINRLATDNYTALYVMHLKTDAGRANHASAQAEFSQAANFGGFSTYYQVDAGDIADFNQTLDYLATSLVDSIQATTAALGAAPSTAQGATTTTAQSAQGSGGTLPPTMQPGNVLAPPAGTSAPTQQQIQFIQNTYAVGRAMRLIYLGRQEGTPPPPIFRAWVPDRDLTNPTAKALDVRLLLNRQQLGDLQEVLKKILKAGQLGQINPDDFFLQLQSASLLMTRQAGNVAQAQELGDIDILNEYLGGLPYTSQIMNVTQRDWSGMSIAGQQEILDNLLSKIRLYQEYHDDTDKWQDFDGRLPDAEALYPIPLDALP